MRNLTGPPVPPHRQTREYQSLPGEGDDSSQNPFNSEAGESVADSSSSRSNVSDTLLGSRVPSANTSTHRHVSVPYAPSIMSGSDFDRYPNRKSVTPDGNLALPGQYSQSEFSERSRTNSFSSYDQNPDSNPFLMNADFSPFGGYPASDFPLHMDEKEADDYLHNPDPVADALEDRKCHRLDRRGWGALIAFVALIGGIITVFVVLPILDFTDTGHGPSKPTNHTQGSVKHQLTDYSYGILSALRSQSLIDADTPSSAQTIKSHDGSTWELVFSDEFNVEGRTFFEGDDPIWTAVDLWYGATQDLEWYSPDAVTTANGCLRIQLDAFQNHNLNYRSGMVQSWNKLCFTEGHVEMAVRLPGSGKVQGLWPGLWTLGNLARPGYLSTSEGVWPYSYNECDAGITPNQSSPDGISYLPGQRLNKCVCPGGDHPNPGVGRGAPEIDILEGTVDATSAKIPNGVASQSVQLAPMDIWYVVDYAYVEIYNMSVTSMNTWTGGPFQQAVSGTTQLNPDWYQQDGAGSFQTFGIEYQNDEVEGYISWFVGPESVYTLYAPAIGPNGNVGARHISKEPMSIIMNAGISNSWVFINWMELVFPAIMEIDYVRIYQPKGQTQLTCDPEDFPTLQYINDHINAYTNPNLTSWEQAGYRFPANSLMNGC